MNRVYRLIWSESQTAYVPVPEFARRRGKGAAVRALSAAVVAALAFHAHALPTGGEVSAGQGGIAQSGGSMTVQQQSQNLAINWQSFGIGASESVNFAQPNASAIALNRVLGADPSQIHGRLTANGQIWLLNPNGVLFGGGAQVNVGGLVASTLNISDADFLAGKRSFSGSGGSVVNLGSLAAGEGGYVALLGGRVSNEGVIQARLGTVALGAGNRITLDFAGDKLLSLQVDQGAVDALVQNKQLIQADGGTVLMSARAADALVGAVVNNTGIVEARTIATQGGTIKLLAEGGTAQVAGTLDASAPNGGDGGFVETSGDRLKVADGAVITTAAPQGKTGEWLIDPTDFTIALSGDISGVALGNQLNQTRVTILSTDGATAGSGDVNVNDLVRWESSNGLTLSALHSVNVNQPVYAGGSANVILRADNTGACVAGSSGCGTVNFNGSGLITVDRGSVAIYYNPPGSNNASDANGNGPSYATPTNYSGNVSGGPVTSWMLVNDVNQLQAMWTSLGGSYAVGKDIDAPATASWNGGAGFVPVGNDSTLFTGIFDGLGHSITGLTINRPSTNYVGLFGQNSGSIRNVILKEVAVNGSSGVGGLVGYNYYGTVSNSYSSGAVTGSSNIVGGLIGQNDHGLVSNSYSTGTVNGGAYVGGLVGANGYGTVSNSYSSGRVNGANSYFYGGLVGYNAYGTVSNSYSVGAVNGTHHVGGLVGYNGNGSTVSNSYSTGAVNGNSGVGGLVGYNYGNCTVSNSYSTGAVNGDSLVGGLLGANYGNVSNSYSTGAVNGTGYAVGGLVGHNARIGSLSFPYGDITNSYSSGTVNGNYYVGGLVGLNDGSNITHSYSTGAVSGASYVGGLVGGNTARDTVDGLLGGKIMNSYSTGAVSGSSSVGGLVGVNGDSFVGSSYWDTQTSGQSTSAGGTGLTTAQMMQMASFSNWDIANTGGSRAIWRIYEGHTAPLLISFLRSLTLTDAPDVTVTYNGSAQTGPGTANTGVLGAAATGTNAGFYNGYYSTQQGYDITGGNLTIDPAILNTISLSGTRAYDGTVNVAAGIFTLGGLVNGEDLSLAGVGTIADPNVGTNKPVSLGTLALGDGSNGLASNYTLSGGTHVATITPYVVDLAGSRTYNGTRDVAAGVFTLGSLVGNETLTLDGIGTLADKHVGVDKVVALGSLALGNGSNGGLAGNYTLEGGTRTATITQAPLTIAAVGDAKTYDGTTGSTATPSVTGLMNGDGVSGASQAFASKNVLGTDGSTLNVTAYTLDDGNHGGNYAVSTPTASGTITPAALTVSTSDVIKPYDGTTSAAGTAVATSGTQLFDTDTLSGGSFAFTDQNAGTNKTVTVGGVTVNDGNGGDNYVVSYANNTTSTIDPKALNANIVGNPTKVYDGTTLAKLTPGNYSLDGVVGGESIALGDTSPKGSYNFQNVSQADTVTASLAGATFTAGAGTLLSNYLLPTSASGAGQITPATLTYVADKTKLTQGSAIPTLTGSVTGFVNNETLDFATTGNALWTTTAMPTSLIGNYAINGDGLTAHYGNYIFVQDAGNAKALTIKKP